VIAASAAASRHLGLDLGATNLKWTVVERVRDDWRVLDRGQATNVAGGPDAIVRQLADLGTTAIDRWPGLSTAGVGVPGSYDPTTGTVGLTVNLGRAWMGRQLAAPLSSALGVPVALINDARAFGVAELRLGAGRGASSMAGVVLGTGVGGVIALDGTVYLGRDGGAGEIGHMTIDPDGPDCNCGNRGCLEAFVRADRIAAACGTSSVEEAVDRAASGDDSVVEALRGVGRYLGIGIANVVVMISADRVVVGGGVARAGDLILAPARDEVQRRVRDTPLEDVEVVTADLGTWAGAIGAALHGALA
jgi:glucokinase